MLATYCAIKWRHWVGGDSVAVHRMSAGFLALRATQHVRDDRKGR